MARTRRSENQSRLLESVDELLAQERKTAKHKVYPTFGRDDDQGGTWQRRGQASDPEDCQPRGMLQELGPLQL